MTPPGAPESNTIAELIDDLEQEQIELQVLCSRLSADEWLTPTAARGWDVRDTIAHLADTDEIAIDTIDDGPRSLNRFVTLFASSKDVTLWGVLRGRRRSGADVLTWWERTSAAERERLAQPGDASRFPWGHRHGASRVRDRADHGDVGTRSRRAHRPRRAVRRHRSAPPHRVPRDARAPLRVLVRQVARSLPRHCGSSSTSRVVRSGPTAPPTRPTASPDPRASTAACSCSACRRRAATGLVATGAVRARSARRRARVPVTPGVSLTRRRRRCPCSRSRA